MTLDSSLPESLERRAFGPAGIAPLVKWLLLLMGAAFVLSAAYANLTHFRSDGANAIAPPLVPGTLLGQTFTARYPDLSAVEIRLSKKGLEPGAPRALVMHLRRAAAPGPDVRTATLRLDAGIEESSYHLFSFEPLPDSQGKSYYLEIESPDGSPGNYLALFWWQQFSPTLLTDPYAGGTAYLDGRPQQGDLAFGLQYSPSPLAAFRQLAETASPNFPGWFLLLLAGALLASAVYFVLWILRLRQGADRPDVVVSRSRRWALPLIVAVALLNGLLYSLLVPPWQGPDEHGHFAYAALLYRHGLDDGAVQRLDWEHKGRDQDEILALKAAVVGSMSEHDWTRRVAGHPTPGAPALPSGDTDLYLQFLWELRQPPAYYWLCAVALQVAQSLGLPVDPWSDPAGALRLMRFVSVLLNGAVVALAWLAGALLGGRKRPMLRWLLPLTVALLPMHSFIASVVSNDILSELAVTALFVSLVALLRRPAGLRGAGLALLALLCFVACAGAKLTAVVAGGPLLGVGLLVWLGILLARLLRRAKGGPLLRPLTAPAIVASLFLLLCLAGGLLTFRQDKLIAGWQSGGGPSERPQHVQTTTAHTGSYVMQLTPGQLAYQWVGMPWPHVPYTYTVSFWARLPDAGKASPATAALLIDERGTLSRIGSETLGAGQASVPFTPTVEWQQFTLIAPGARGDRKLWVRFMSGEASVQIDDIALHATPATPVASPGENAGVTSQPFDLPVFNPSAEIGSLSVSPFGARFLRGENKDIVDVLVNPQAFSKSSVWERYADRQFRSFWGNFGWLSIPLPTPFYTLIDAGMVLALLGLVVLAVRRLGRWSSFDCMPALLPAALGASVIMTFARQMAPLSTSGVHTDPQGRYLFGYTIPVVWLLLVGLATVWSYAAKAVKALFAGKAAQATLANPHLVASWGVWLWCSSLVFFAGYSLLALIAPYYYK